MIKKIFEYIKSNEYIFFSLYSSISLILVYFFYKLKLFRKFDDLRIVFLLNSTRTLATLIVR